MLKRGAMFTGKIVLHVPDRPKNNERDDRSHRIQIEIASTAEPAQNRYVFVEEFRHHLPARHERDILDNNQSPL